MGIPKAFLNHPLVRRATANVRADLSGAYSRNMHKWLIIAPIVGVVTGLLICGLTQVILVWIWPHLLAYYLAHHWVIIPGLIVGFLVAGLIMQYLTPNPDEHSTEEIIKSYHEHQGHIDVKSSLPKLVAAVATVGFGGSAALEGPSIYGGGAIGSFLWTRLRWLKNLKLDLDPRDRRIMMICGAAGGMAAVFRAPLTGIVFALEMPYKDDLAHEALMPSLICSVVSYATLAAILGADPLFNFVGAKTGFTGTELLGCVALGIIVGLVAMVFTTTFRRFRGFMVSWGIPHWQKMVLGGALTGVCGLAFVTLYPGNLIPIGTNYEAVNGILQHHLGTTLLIAFAAFKLLATLFSLGSGGVSAMFVPLFLCGGAFGIAFAQSVVHSSSVELYAAVGMASFIAAGYKAPLTAVVFVAEATGGHAFIIPTLIGAAVAYAISGETSASGDQRLHEGVKLSELQSIQVSEIMQRDVISVEASSTLQAFMQGLAANRVHAAYPVFEAGKPVGVVSVHSIIEVDASSWSTTTIRDIMEHHLPRVALDCDVTEALRLLMDEKAPHLLLVCDPSGALHGVVTGADVLSSLALRRDIQPPPALANVVPIAEPAARTEAS